MKAAEIIDAYKALCEKARAIAPEYAEDWVRHTIGAADHVLVARNGDAALFAYWDDYDEGYPPRYTVEFPVSLLDMGDDEFAAWRASVERSRAEKEAAEEAEYRAQKEIEEREFYARLKAKYESE